MISMIKRVVLKNASRQLEEFDLTMSVIYVTNEATERIHLVNENLGVTVLRQVKLSLWMKRGQAASFIPRWICIQWKPHPSYLIIWQYDSCYACDVNICANNDTLQVGNPQ